MVKKDTIHGINSVVVASPEREWEEPTASLGAVPELGNTRAGGALAISLDVPVTSYREKCHLTLRKVAYILHY